MINERTLWISHSALSSFAKCPHLYYLEYEYRNPSTGNRIQITNPYLSLGLAVHQSIEGVLDFPLKERRKISLLDRFSQIFNSYRGLKGGFLFKKKEEEFYKRGLEMIERVNESSLLDKEALKTTSSFPTLELFSQKELGVRALLVGSIDWIELLPNKTAHIIDFKTGNSKENKGSLQLPIYAMLGEKNIKEKIGKLSYWYLQHDNSPVEQKIQEIKQYLHVIKEKTKDIKKAIDNQSFHCDFHKKCFGCKDYEKIFKGEAILVEKTKGEKKDTFCIFKDNDVIEKIIEEDFLDEREKKIFEMRLTTDVENIKKELRLEEKKLKKITEDIKMKLKKNLHQKELKVIVKILNNAKEEVNNTQK